jgi:ATP-binding cassette subfamily C protein
MLSWKATLSYLATGSLLLFTLHHLVSMSKRAGKKRTLLLKSLLRHLADSLQSVKPLKAMASEDLASAVLSIETEKLNRALRREVFSKEALKAAQDPMFTIVVAVGFYIALVYLGLPAATVIVLVILLSRVLKNLGKIQRQYQNLVACEAAFWSLHHTIEEARREVEPSVGREKPRLQQSVRLEDVSFAYPNKPVLNNVSLSIPVGSFTAVMGMSGAGKTTLVDLIIGLLQPTSGRVWVDDLPLEEVDIHLWRSIIGYVPQDNLLLHDSVYHNITLGVPELNEADVERALRAAEAWDFVNKLPQGLYASVGERGVMLSGGQRQRIMIARALVNRRKLLILDEPTSSLDPASEAAVCETLRHLRGEYTILAISHQPALMDAADRIYRLENGHVSLVSDKLTARTQLLAAAKG